MRRAHESEQAQMSFTSLIDVAFLLIIFFMCLPFQRLDHKLEAFLPKGDGPVPTLAPPKETVRIRVRKRENALLYVLGDHSAPSAADLRPTLRALGPDNAYEVDATEKVPWQGVVDVVNVLREIGCTEVRFRGGPAPGREIRQR